MNNELDPHMQEVVAYSAGTTTQDLIDFVLEKSPARDIHCAVCGHSDIRFIGTDEQVFVFGMPALLTDSPNDKRQYMVSVGECFNCGHVHLFAPNTVSEWKRSKNAGGDV
ncbi:MAG: hypothetical protein ACRCTP_08125 [Aeromonas popoffii]|uniref:hypothetical protein n=1 Tax=Aeromonas popoffii TaxID=70856 RepID=UPI003F35DBBA